MDGRLRRRGAEQSGRATIRLRGMRVGVRRQTPEDRQPLGQAEAPLDRFGMLPELDADRGTGERDPDVGEHERRDEHRRHAAVGRHRAQLAEPAAGVDDHRGAGVCRATSASDG